MKTIFFDLDGTLTDSGAGILNSIEYAIKKLGKPLPSRSELELFIGPPLLTSFMEITGFTEKEGQQGILYFREYFEKQGIFENELYPGVVELLQGLKEKGYPVYLTTSKPEPYAVKILEHFQIKDYFKGIYGATMDEKRSEKTHIIAYALANITPEVVRSQTVMVGDRSYDILGAKDHQLKSVGALYGFGSKEELEQAKADFLIQQPLDLLKLF